MASQLESRTNGRADSKEGNTSSATRSASANKKMTLSIPMLPCWDETDDGVPPPCRGKPACWKVFNHDHPITNDNLIMIMLGNVGYPYFDRNRTWWMGGAMWSTLLSIFFTIWGCCALSLQLSVIVRSRWLWIRGTNEEEGKMFIVYMGLRSLVYETEPCVPTHCTRQSYNFETESEWPIEFLDEALEECRDFSVGLIFSVFVTCATLVFALIGTMNRMRFSADAAVQKALGMVCI